MIKINKEFLIEKIAANYSKYDKNLGIPAIEPAMVLEFKIGKKYAYRLNNTHADYNGICKTQENLASEFLTKIPINSSAKAYVSKKSYLDFLEPHRHNFFFVRTDLRNFFHSISTDLLIENFKPYFDNEFSSDNEKQYLIDAFLNLISYDLPDNSRNKTYLGKRILPMGFKTSPVISNIIFRKIDILIEDFCSQHHITYTRYADDMLFSSKTNHDIYDSPFVNKKDPEVKPKAGFIHSDRFIDEISFLVKIDGFKINTRKTIKSMHTISINGYTIEGTNYSDLQGTIRISNKKTYIIEKLIYEIKKGTSHQDIMHKLFDFKVSNEFFNYLPVKKEHVERYCKDQIDNKIVGYRSYLISILKYNSEHQCIDDNSIFKYERLINNLETLI